MSAIEMDYPQELLEIIYVDTGSTDGTKDIARTIGIKVVEMSSSAPSAALARNRGLEEARDNIIHFIDGDMVIDPGYLRKAVSRLSNGDVASVIGRVTEKHADDNWIVRMLNMDWKKKEEGLIEAPGGGGTFIKAALEQVGGYNACLSLAEETDIGIRLRAKGYKIYLLNDAMAVHDYGVKNIRDLCFRYFAHGRGRFRILVCENVAPAVRKWSLKLPVQAAAALAVLGLFLVRGHIPAAMALLLAYPVVYIVRVIVSDWKYIMKRKQGLYAFLYSYVNYLMKPVIFAGMLMECIAYTMRLFRRNHFDIPQ